MIDTLSETQKAYLAGFFDADGCVSSHTNHRIINLAFIQKDLPLILELQAWLGKEDWRIHTKHQDEPERTSWELRSRSRDAMVRFILSVGKYTVKKKNQLVAALGILGTVTYPGGRVGEKTHIYRRKLARFIIENRRYRK